MAAARETDVEPVLLPVEIEAVIEGLKSFEIKEIGCPRWQKQHEYVEKLNMQALMNASSQDNEYVKEALTNNGKVPLLVEDLILTEVWKQKVFEVIRNTKFKPPTTIPLYMVLYHEATLVNILETVFFHRDCVESADDAVLELLDYCYRKLTSALVRAEQEAFGDSKDTETNSLEELAEQGRTMEFEMTCKLIGILRYIIDCAENIPVSALSRILDVHNMPCLLVQLVETPPWTKKTGGKISKFVDGKWTEISPAEVLTLTKLEAQVWLSLYGLLMSPECIRKYDFNSFNKTQILKLIGFMNNVLIDQLPVLGEMRRYLEQLSMTDPPPPQRNLILEQIPEIRENLLKKNEGKWKAIAKYQMQNYFNPSVEEITQQAKRLADTYNFDVLDSLMTEVPKCSNCGEEASKRCSRCKHEWYCRRQCQVEHWTKHKPICEVMMQSLKK